MSHVHAGVRCCDTCGEPLTGKTRWIITGDPPVGVPCPECTRPEAKLAWMIRNPGR